MPPSEGLAPVAAVGESAAADVPPDGERDLEDPARPLRGVEMRQRAQQRTLYLAASLSRRGFTPDLPQGDSGAAPQLRYLDRYVRLVRLLAHGHRLFDDVLPRIRNRLSFTPERFTEARPFQARGPVDWPATLRGAWGRAEANPTVLVSRRPTRDYATPENELTALTVATVRRDAGLLLRELAGRLAAPEEAQLRRLVVFADRTRRVPQLATLTDQLPPELLDDPDGLAARRLERATAERGRYRPRTMTAYLDLVAWREAWRTWLTGATDAVLKTPIWEVDDNTLYEFVVLFELASAFAQRSRRAAQRRAVGEGGRPLFAFELDGGRELELWYQSAHGLDPYTAVGGIPDVTIRVGGRTIIGDMKNYAPTTYTEAVYKLLGYLYNFGYPDRWAAIDAAVVFLPEPAGPHEGFQVLPPRVTPAPGGQDVMSLVVPPGGEAAAATGAFAEHVLRGGPGVRLETSTRAR